MLAFRLIVLLLLAYVIFAIISTLLLAQRTRRLKRSQERADPAKELVLCLHCKSYVPKTDAVHLQRGYFCAEPCARLSAGAP